jgi:soluble lytic murein transglycosylase-like protein
MMKRAIGRSAAALLAALSLTFSGASLAQAAAPATACGPASPLGPPIARASLRFAIPETLIRAVIAVESGGKIWAVSPKGAMGLMQLMPGTWGELRLRFALGADPFDPCDNIFAGTAYLRQLLDQYGDPGFLAAYNAGPGRYEAYLFRGRPLPAETVAYVAKLSSRMLDPAPGTRESAPDPDAWRRGPLFVGSADSSTDEEAEPAPARLPNPGDEQSARPAEPPRDTIFVPRSGAPK